jgi:hypothetical protein
MVAPLRRELGGNRRGCCDDSRPDRRLRQIPPRSGTPVASTATAARFKSSSTGVTFEQAKHAVYWRTL